MKVPAWVYIVGICMIVFGGVGFFGGLANQAMTSSGFMEDYNENMEKSMENMSSDEKDALKTMGLDDLSLSENDLEISNELTSLGLVVSFVYFVGGIILLLKRKFSLKVVYFALGLSILIAVYKYVVLSGAESSILQISAYTTLAITIVDVILLIIVLFADKTQWKYLTGEFQVPDEV